MAENDLIVGGYRFRSPLDAETARAEEKKIAYIEAHLDRESPETVLRIYNKMLENRIFVTPVGYAYLREIRDFLLRDGMDPETLLPLPLNDIYSPEAKAAREKVSEIGKEQVDEELKKGKSRLFLSLVLNVLLFITIVAMVIITLISDHPNILNYERVIQNEYAEWKQELTEREKAVREKERELMIEAE